MALGLDTIKRDFARHKKRAGILAVLAIVLIVFIVNAVSDMSSPRIAAADSSTLAPSSSPELAAITPESEEHLRLSKELWTKLNEEPRGLDPSVAFTFDTDHGDYILNPNHKAAPVPEHPEPVDLTPKTPVTSIQAQLEAHKNALLAETRSINVRSTVVGAGISKPVAVINDSSATLGDRILGVGDRIKGFEITAIRAREVEFKKDGITLAVKMADDAHTK